MNEKPKVVNLRFTRQLYRWGLSFGEIGDFHLFGPIVKRTPISLVSDDSRPQIEMDVIINGSHDHI